MIQLNEKIIYTIIESACDLLSKNCSLFTKPTITYIKITNAKGYWCNIKKDYPGYRIHISRNFELIPDDSLAKERLYSSLTHELIHTIPGCMNHGEKFKRICSLLNKINPTLKLQVTTSFLDYGIIEKRKSPKYVCKCNYCGKEYLYWRKPNYNMERYLCGKCGKSQLKIFPYSEGTYFSV